MENKTEENLTQSVQLTTEQRTRGDRGRRRGGRGARQRRADNFRIGKNREFMDKIHRDLDQKYDMGPFDMICKENPPTNFVRNERTLDVVTSALDDYINQAWSAIECSIPVSKRNGITQYQYRDYTIDQMKYRWFINYRENHMAKFPEWMPVSEKDYATARQFSMNLTPVSDYIESIGKIEYGGTTIFPVCEEVDFTRAYYPEEDPYFVDEQEDLGMSNIIIDDDEAPAASTQHHSRSPSSKVRKIQSDKTPSQSPKRRRDGKRKGKIKLVPSAAELKLLSDRRETMSRSGGWAFGDQQLVGGADMDASLAFRISSMLIQYGKKTSDRAVRRISYTAKGAQHLLVTVNPAEHVGWSIYPMTPVQLLAGIADSFGREGTRGGIRCNESEAMVIMRYDPAVIRAKLFLMWQTQR